jgi:hypothetical protein
MFLGSERSAGLRSVAPAHQRRDALAQGEDDDQASRSGTRWYRSAGWWRCGRADGRGQVRGARCQSQSRQRRCAGVGTAAVEVVKADLLDPALSVPRSRGRMEPLSSPTSGIPRRCRVRPRSVRRPCKPPALPGSHRNLKDGESRAALAIYNFRSTPIMACRRTLPSAGHGQRQGRAAYPSCRL